MERLAQAKESIEEAELLWKEKMGNKLILAKLYHAMMYCLFALLNLKDIGDLTHADIIERFEREFVQKGLFAGELFSALRSAYDLTHECDCDRMPVPTDETIEQTMEAAKEFIRDAEAYYQGGV